MGINDNLPPGVTASMIPGNTPEDEAWDHFWDEYDFTDVLQTWATEHNTMLEMALSEIQKKSEPDDFSIFCQCLAGDHEQDLPVKKWFEEWIGRNKNGK